MAESTGKGLRLAEFINKRSTLLVDTSIAGSNGYIGELMEARKIIPELARNADGIILNPGQLEQISSKLPGRKGAAVIMRLDWTNVFRGNEFPLPHTRATRVMIAGPEDGLRLGAAAVIINLILGFDEVFEARNIADLAEAARRCSRINLPLLVDLYLPGPKVGGKNLNDAVKLGVGFMVEGGADAVIIPEPDRETVDILLEFSPVPIIVRCNAGELGSKKSLEKLNNSKFSGFCLGRDLYEQENGTSAVDLVKEVYALVQKNSLAGE